MRLKGKSMIVFSLVIMLTGCGSKLSTGKAETACKKEGSEKISIERMTDILEGVDTSYANENIQSLDLYLTTKNKDDIKKISNSINATDYPAKKSLLRVAAGNKYVLLFTATEYKSKDDAGKVMETAIENNPITAIAKTTKANPGAIGESTTGSKNNVDYYIAEYDGIGLGNNNIIYAFYKSRNTVYTLRGEDIYTSTKAQRMMDNVCTDLGVISPSELVSHTPHYYTKNYTEVLRDYGKIGNTENINDILDESKYTAYDGATVTGSQVIAAITTLKDDPVVITVDNNVTMMSFGYISGPSYNAESYNLESSRKMTAAEFSEALIKAQDSKDYTHIIMPSGIFIGKVIRDSNTGKVTAIAFIPADKE